MRYLFCLLFSFLAVSCFADELKFKSKDANKAVTTYQQSLKKLDATYERKKKELHEKLLDGLEAARKKATQADNLDDAIKIRNAIQASKKGKATVAKAPKERGIKIPTKAFKWQGHHYYVSSMKLPWHAASAYCQSVGGHLVRIESAAEQQFVTALINKSGLKGDCWIDLSDALVEGRWVYSNGKIARYVNWNANEPDNADKKQHSAYIFGEKWYDSNTDSRISFICEWDQ